MKFSIALRWFNELFSTFPHSCLRGFAKLHRKPPRIAKQKANGKSRFGRVHEGFDMELVRSLSSLQGVLY